MTVKELLQKLSELPDQDKEVMIGDDNLGSFRSILEVYDWDEEAPGYLLWVEVDFTE